MKNNAQKGFILIYTVLILSVILITSSIFVNTVLKEVGISRDDMESLKAFYAADAGIECVRYFEDNFDAFDTQTPEKYYNCGIGSSFPAGGDGSGGVTPACTAAHWAFQISGFSNGSCVKITVDTTPVTGGICTANVVADGLNQCSGSGKQVERTRWETM